MNLAASRVGAARPSYVFLHGLFGQGRNWTSIARHLEPAGSLLVDLPNHGDSDWTETFDYDEIADHVAHLLRVGGAVEHPVTLVGHSLGGKVAMRLALRHPGLVGRLAVIDMSPVAARVGDFSHYTEAMLGLDLQHLTDRRQIESALAPAVQDERVLGFLMQNLRRRRDGGGYEWRPHLALLAVLWVAGAESRYVLPEHAAPMRALFPRVRLVTVKGAGHWVHADRPDVVADLIGMLGAWPVRAQGV